MPRFRSIGFMPAATDFIPSRTIACASTVAVVVPSPAWSWVFDATALYHLCAHVLELVLKLDFLGDRNAILGDSRCTEALVHHDVAAFGPERHTHRIGKNVDTSNDSFSSVALKT